MDWNEASRIPFATGEIPGRRWLVVAPHPDDEILGPGGTLALGARRGVEIRVVVVTDGAEGGEGDDLVARRAEESREAARRIGTPEPEFLGLPDRGLGARRAELRARLAQEVERFAPDVVLAPSPLELHPDHRIVAEEVFALAAGGRLGEPTFEALRHARIAFYEVATPIPAPNLLVDVGPALEAKRAGVAAFASQSRHDYGGVAEAFLALRRLTLPAEVGGAEAFHVMPVAEAAACGLGGVVAEMTAGSTSPLAAEVEPLTVVVRTRDRPIFLREALRSLAAGSVRPQAVVVVRDGGLPIDAVVDDLGERLEIRKVDLPTSRGRVAAANAGVEKVETSWFTFLDDDDVVYPDHLEVLGRTLRTSGANVVYTDAVSTIHRRASEDEAWTRVGHYLQHSHDFDADLLSLFNYLPLHTVAIPTALFRELGGFDPTLDLSEDWDFLLRLARRTPFLHVRRTTCEYRVFEGPGGPTHAPSGNEGFQAAREEIYRRHAARSSIARAVDALRRESETLVSRNWEIDGRRREAEASASEWERQVEEARRAFVRLGAERIELEGRIALAKAEVEARDESLTQAATAHEEHQREICRLRAELERLEGMVATAFDTEKTLREQLARDQVQLDATWGEISRLNGVVATIERSRTWRLHRLLERMRGRG